jgi:hypothetical protein
MKSTQKGNLYEKEVKTILEADGWHVEGQHRKVMWIRDKYTGQMKMIMAGRDIFGVDLIAKKLGQKTRWIQVSTLTQKSAKQKQVLIFPWTLEHESVELWLRLDGKRSYRVFKLMAANDLKELGLLPKDQFVEMEQQDLKRSKNERDNEGTGGTEEAVASEYPE